MTAPADPPTSAGSMMPAVVSPPLPAARHAPTRSAAPRGFFGLIDRLDASADRLTRAGHSDQAQGMLAIRSRLGEIANELPAAIQAAIGDDDEGLKSALSFLQNTL